jgi:ribose 5-phosphate isomerase B
MRGEKAADLKQKQAIFMASDHAGFRLKRLLRAKLASWGYEVKDFGAESDRPSDYPDFIIPCAEAVSRSRGRASGIVIGGSGNGECMAANKVRGVRAALCYDLWTARKSREHNDANVLCLGARTPSGKLKAAETIVKAWLSTCYRGEPRHKRRVGKITKYESK